MQKPLSSTVLSVSASLLTADPKAIVFKHNSCHPCGPLNAYQSPTRPENLQEHSWLQG